MTRSSRTEWLFGVFFVCPIALYVISVLIGSEGLRQLSGYLIIPISFVFVAAFVANFFSASRSSNKRKDKEREINLLLDTLVDQPQSLLKARRLDGSEITVRFQNQSFSVADNQQTTSMSKTAACKEILTYCTVWETTSGES